MRSPSTPGVAIWRLPSGISSVYCSSIEKSIFSILTSSFVVNSNSEFSWTGAVSGLVPYSVSSGISWTGGVSELVPYSANSGTSWTGALSGFVPYSVSSGVSRTGDVSGLVPYSVSSGTSWTGAVSRFVPYSFNSGTSWTGDVSGVVPYSANSGTSWTGVSFGIELAGAVPTKIISETGSTVTWSEIISLFTISWFLRKWRVTTVRWPRTPDCMTFDWPWANSSVYWYFVW